MALPACVALVFDVCVFPLGLQIGFRESILSNVSAQTHSHLE